MEDEKTQDPLVEPLMVAAIVEREVVTTTENINNDDEKMLKMDDSTEIVVEATPAADDAAVVNSEELNPSFPIGSRGAVDGAAAVFFTAGFLVAGPLLGVVTAAGAAHLAANKEGCIPNFVRTCGEWLDGVGKNSQYNNTNHNRRRNHADINDARVDNDGAVYADSAALPPKDNVEEEEDNDQGHKVQTTPKKQLLFSRITDELVHGVEWIEERLFHNPPQGVPREPQQYT